MERLTNTTGTLHHSFIDGEKAEWAVIVAKLWNNNFHVAFFTEDLSKRRDMEVAPGDLPHSPNYLVKEIALTTAKNKGPLCGDTIFGRPPRILLKAAAEKVFVANDDDEEEEEKEYTIAGMMGM